MGEAIFGLIGVVVGALLTAGFEWWRDKERVDREQRLARRIVAAELAHSASTLSAVAKGETWPKFPDPLAVVPTTAWQQHQGALADCLNENTWELVVGCYVLLENERVLLLATGAHENVEYKISDDQRQQIERVVETIRQVRELLLRPK